MTGANSVFHYACDCEVSTINGACSADGLVDCSKMSRGELEVYAREQQLAYKVLEVHWNHARAQLKRYQSFEALIENSIQMLHRRIAELLDVIEELKAEAADRPLKPPREMCGGRVTFSKNEIELEEEIAKLRRKVSELEGKLGESRAVRGLLERNGPALTEEELKKVASKILGMQAVEEDIIATIDARENKILDNYVALHPSMRAECDKRVADMQSEVERTRREMQAHQAREASAEELQQAKQTVFQQAQELQALRNKEAQQSAYIEQLRKDGQRQAQETSSQADNYQRQLFDASQNNKKIEAAYKQHLTKFQEAIKNKDVELKDLHEKVQKSESNTKQLWEKYKDCDKQRQELLACSTPRGALGQGDSNTITPPQYGNLNYGSQVPYNLVTDGQFQTPSAMATPSAQAQIRYKNTLAAMSAQAQQHSPSGTRPQMQNQQGVMNPSASAHVSVGQRSFQAGSQGMAQVQATNQARSQSNSLNGHSPARTPASGASMAAQTQQQYPRQQTAQKRLPNMAQSMSTQNPIPSPRLMQSPSPAGIRNSYGLPITQSSVQGNQVTSTPTHPHPQWQQMSSNLGVSSPVSNTRSPQPAGASVQASQSRTQTPTTAQQGGPRRSNTNDIQQRVVQKALRDERDRAATNQAAYTNNNAMPGQTQIGLGAMNHAGPVQQATTQPGNAQQSGTEFGGSLEQLPDFFGDLTQEFDLNFGASIQDQISGQSFQQSMQGGPIVTEYDFILDGINQTPSVPTSAQGPAQTPRDTTVAGTKRPAPSPENEERRTKPYGGRLPGH